MTNAERYMAYLASLDKPFRKLSKIEFLQPDNSVAFALGGNNRANRVDYGLRNSSAFIQSGNLNVALKNGTRRTASVTLSNLNSSFDYAVNKLWFGQRIRLSMGMELFDGTDFYIPQGVFYILNPSNLISYSQRTTSLALTDKWAVLDGTLFGKLDSAYTIKSGANIFKAISSVLKLSRFDYSNDAIPNDRIDNVTPVFTNYYDGKTYSASQSDGSIIEDIAMTDTPYDITENRGSSCGALILKLNDMLVANIGYDATGALRLDPSQDDISDIEKPVLHTFSTQKRNLISLTEAPKPQEIYNAVTIAGEGLTDSAVWAKASNYDPRSDTNINLIGQKLYTEERADYWNAEQCASLARWQLKRKTILQKAVSVECGQMFHLQENKLIAVERTDKKGSPLEKHLIQGYSIPISEGGSMKIDCTSVVDIPDFTIQTYVS